VDFSPGDVVVHPQHGTATVVDVEERTVAGTTRRYVVLRHADDDLVLRVPLESLEDLGVRATAGEDQVKRILDTLAATPEELSDSWQKRRALNERRIRSGDARQCAAVVRDLTAWGRGRELLTEDRRMLDDARRRTVNELADALGREPQEVEALVDEQLSTTG
jgi:CarD family transcriptional regulator